MAGACVPSPHPLLPFKNRANAYGIWYIIQLCQFKYPLYGSEYLLQFCADICEFCTAIVHNILHKSRVYVKTQSLA